MPKISCSFRIIIYYKSGKFHRDNGPAIEKADMTELLSDNVSHGHKCWYRNGLRHREDGPAVEGSGDLKIWFLNGIYVKKEDFEWND